MNFTDENPSASAGGRAREPARAAVLCNAVTPYRLHLHQRIVEEVPEIELWTLSTHSNAYHRWADTLSSDGIRAVSFGDGEPANEQTQWQYALREWRKGGRIIRWLQEHPVRVLFCQGCGDIGRLRVLRWCARNRMPCFLTGDFNVRGDRLTGWRRSLKRLVYSSAVGWSTGLMPCGRRGRLLLDRYGGEAKPAFWFPFLPDTQLLRDTPPEAVMRAQERFGLEADRRRIVYCGRLAPVKRPDLIVSAFAEVARQRPDWDLVMLGDGALREAVQGRVPPSIADRVVWTGPLQDPEDVAAVYAQCDALVLPSDHEPWGVVVVEAAAAGLAIVTSDVVGAAAELVQEGRNGHTFAAGDLGALVHALLEVTAIEKIDDFKHQSPQVLDEWLEYADPVAGFRAALASCGLLRRVQRSRHVDLQAVERF